MKTIKIGLIIGLCMVFVQIHAQVQQVDVTVFGQKLTSDNVQLLDVRTSEEFSQGYIPDAMLADWKEKEEFERRVSAMDKERPVLVYCLSGGRSKQAAEYLDRQGFKVWELKGGISAWKQEDKKVEGAVKAEQISEKAYQALLESSEYVLVDFGAPWCPPCRKMEPVLEELKEMHPELSVVNMNAGTQSELMKAHKVQELPTYILYKNGEQIWRDSGVIELSQFVEALQ